MNTSFTENHPICSDDSSSVAPKEPPAQRDAAPRKNTPHLQVAQEALQGFSSILLQLVEVTCELSQLAAVTQRRNENNTVIHISRMGVEC